MKRAVLYARVSGDDRAKTGGENVKAQLEMCREYAQKKGYVIVAELAEDDRGASGALLDLPELSRAIDMAQAGEYDVLIVREVDRLARSMAKCQIVEGELRGHKVKVEYALYDFPDTAEGRLNKNIYASFAEYEREKIAQRMTWGKLRKLRDGDVINHGRSPFGYKNVVVDGKRALEIAPEEAETVKRVFSWYIAGDGESSPLSLRKIAARLTKLHVPTYADRRNPQECTQKTAMGFGEWGMSSVASILSNEAYTGVWRYGRRRWAKEDQIPLSIPVIIDRETWEIAQERKARNKKHSKRNRKYDYLMTGRLECGGCGRLMSGNPKRNGQGYLWLTYRCQAKRRGYSCLAKRSEVSAGRVDDLAWGWVKELMGDEKGLRESLRAYKEQREEITRPFRDKLRVASNLIAEGEKKLTLLLDLYLDGEYSKEILTERKQRTEKELVGLRREQARYTSLIQEQEFSEERINTVLEFAQEVREGLEEANEDFDARRRFVELLDVTGVLTTENDTRRLDLSCVVGDKKCIVSTSSIDAGIPDRGSCCT